MKFNQYIVEEKFDSIYNKLHKDCAPFFNELKGNKLLLYRSIKESSLVGVRSTRKNRKPKDTGKVVHGLFDDMLDKKFGFKGRSQAMFCSGEMDWWPESDRYGKPFTVFPIGKYKYIWSPVVTDSYSRVSDGALGMIIYREFTKEAEKLWIPYNEKTIKAFTLVQYCIDITVRFNNDGELTKEERKLVVDAMKNAVNGMKYKNTDLVGAIKSKHEIMLQCDKYYYFNTSEYRDQLNWKLFGVE